MLGLVHTQRLDVIGKVWVPVMGLQVPRLGWDGEGVLV